MAKGDPKVHSKGEDFSGTKHGSAHGAKMGPVGVPAHSKDEDYSGTMKGKVVAQGGAMAEGGNRGHLGHAMKHLKAHHSAKHHMVGKHKVS
jgi:hypothetical protein